MAFLPAAMLIANLLGTANSAYQGYKNREKADYGPGATGLPDHYLQGQSPQSNPLIQALMQRRMQQPMMGQQAPTPYSPFAGFFR